MSLLSDLGTKIGTQLKSKLSTSGGTITGNLDVSGLTKLYGVKIDGLTGNQTSGTDAALWINSTTNSDWSIILDSDQGSASDFGISFRGGTTHTYAYDARSNNNIYYRVGTDKLFYNGLIHAGEKLGVGIEPVGNEAFTVDAIEGIWHFHMRDNGVSIGGIHANNDIFTIKSSNNNGILIDSNNIGVTIEDDVIFNGVVQRGMIIAHNSTNSGLIIQNVDDAGTRNNLVLKSDFDRDVGIQFETNGGSFALWQDSNGDDSLIISPTTAGLPSVEFYQNKNVGFYDTVGSQSMLWNADTVELSINNNKVWHAGNDGLGSGLDADTLHGLQPNSNDIGNTIVSRNSEGDSTFRIVNVSNEIRIGMTGAATDPAITFSGDEDTGIYNVNGNEMKFVTGGTDSLLMSAGGLNAYGNNGLFIRTKTNSGGAKLHLSDHQAGNYAQYGTLEYWHSDSAIVSGYYDAFVLKGTEPETVFKVDADIVTQEVVAEKVTIDGDATGKWTIEQNSTTGDLEFIFS